MTTPDSFTVASYSKEGEALGTETVAVDSLNAEHIEFFAEKLQYLTDDLDLPVESYLPGNPEFMEFRIGSIIDGAYVMYYFHDEVIFSSLLLNGSDNEAESELMHIFRYLVIDTDDMEDPTEEEIEKKLHSSTEFDFAKVETRPALFEIPSYREDEAEQYKIALEMNRHLAVAFYGIDR